MKALMILTLMIAASSSFAAPAASQKKENQKVCDWAEAKADLECSHYMCDDDIKNGTYKNLNECTTAADYGEAAQEGCYGQTSSVEDIMKNYNKKHGTNIQCDQ